MQHRVFSSKNYFLLLVCLSFIVVAQGVTKRCFSCRSRGELGSCKDKFKFTNASQIDEEQGVEVSPCASGWCGKVTEGSSTFRNEDYDTATQRMCLQRGPSDDEEHCAETVVNRNKVFMCFCRGDLCNSANSTFLSNYSLVLLVSFSIAFSLRRHLLL